MFSQLLHPAPTLPTFTIYCHLLWSCLFIWLPTHTHTQVRDVRSVKHGVKTRKWIWLQRRATQLHEIKFSGMLVMLLFPPLSPLSPVVSFCLHRVAYKKNTGLNYPLMLKTTRCICDQVPLAFERSAPEPLLNGSTPIRVVCATWLMRLT